MVVEIQNALDRVKEELDIIQKALNNSLVVTEKEILGLKNELEDCYRLLRHLNEQD